MKKFGELINQKELVLLIFDDKNREVHKEIAANLEEVKVIYLEIFKNRLLFKALKLSKPCLILYKKGSEIYRTTDFDYRPLKDLL